MRFKLLFLLLFILTSIHISAQSDWIKGLSVVGPRQAYAENPMLAVSNIGSNWISVIPFGHVPYKQPIINYDKEERNVWGESIEGVTLAIQLAHEQNIKVMLKPQLYVPGDWPGGIDFDNEEDWGAFEAEYTKYLMTFVDLANELDVEMICIATEIKISVQKREAYWRDLIKHIRSVYDGQLIYAANWDNYTNVPFWDALDYIGVDAYFPLTDKKTPSKKHLISAWQPTKSKLRSIAKKYNKKIVFTEFGYLSVDRCAYKCWLLEKKVTKTAINEVAQANAYDALYEVYTNESFWAGGFLWKWFPEMKGHEGYPERDYTPQGKKSEGVIKNWFKNN